MKVQRTYPNETRVVAHARRFVLAAIGEAPDELLSDVQLMTSELVSNALVHASSACTVTVETHEQTVTVAVTDVGGGEPTVRDPDDDQLSGRGLLIVAALARAWGIDDAAPSPGKTVWFSVELPRGTDPEDQHAVAESLPLAPVPAMAMSDLVPSSARSSQVRGGRLAA